MDSFSKSCCPPSRSESLHNRSFAQPRPLMDQRVGAAVGAARSSSRSGLKATAKLAGFSLVLAPIQNGTETSGPLPAYLSLCWKAWIKTRSEALTRQREGLAHYSSISPTIGSNNCPFFGRYFASNRLSSQLTIQYAFIRTFLPFKLSMEWPLR